ncbi:MAG: PEP-CTERM sorting domain-containing protein [Planctomycetota bacterium]
MPCPVHGLASTLAATLVLAAAPLASAQITDLNNWFLVEDDPNGSLTATVAPDGSSVTLSINGPINANDDIGLSTINGFDAGTSSLGFAFDPAQSFRAAIDFNVSNTAGILGSLALGFGLGEDIDGTDSVGAGILLVPSLPATQGFVAALDGDTLVGSFPLSGVPTFPGSLIVDYDAGTGNVLAGYAGPGDSDFVQVGPPAPVGPLWDNEPLILSLFINGGAPVGTGVSAVVNGPATVTFSNPRVIPGSPFVIPEPSAIALLVLGVLPFTARRRRHHD